MLLIAHRGNIHGANPKRENHPSYIDEALNLGIDAEVDVWYEKGWWLGHDEPQYKLDMKWFKFNGSHLWIHCKNLAALYKFTKNEVGLGHFMPNYFWHENDQFTLTSLGVIWTYPREPLTSNSVCVMPEIGPYTDKQLKKCWGVCTDDIRPYQKI